MTKNLIFVLSLLSSISLQGQNLYRLNTDSKSENLKSVAMEQSPGGAWNVTRTRKFINEIPVYASHGVQIETQSGSIIQSKSLLLPIPVDPIPQEIRIAHLKSKYKTNRVELAYYPVDGRYKPVYVVNYSLNSTHAEEIILDLGLNSLKVTDRLMYHKDTTVEVNVFNPDPLTTSATNYGDIISDNSDQSSTQLDQEMVKKTLRLHFDTAQQKLLSENEYLVLDDFSAPNIPVQFDLLNNFEFNRSESEFEQFNVMYHITNFLDYLESMGFADVLSYQIHVDPHGFNGADNSAFNYLSSPKELVFGEGGVDDAEDADVIIHELVHAVFDALAPNVNSGNELRALQESISDVFAVNYSRAIDPFNWHQVFNWDGHNEFWPGRIANSPNDYTHIIGNPYQDAEIWTGTMMDIYDLIGREELELIMMEAIRGSFDQMTMVDMATLMLQADLDLNQSEFYTDLCSVFVNRKFFETCPLEPVSVVDNNLEQGFEFKVINDLLYVNNLSQQRELVSLVDLQGKTLHSTSIIGAGSIAIGSMAPGVYLLQVGDRVEKLIINP